MASIQRFLNYKTQSVMYFVLFLFLIKGLVLTSIIPAFQGPDEPTHYTATENVGIGSEEDRYPKKIEVSQTLEMLQFDEIAWQKTNTQDFETPRVLQNNFDISKYSGVVSIGSASSLSYTIGSWLGAPFPDQPVASKIFIIRLSSIIFGLLTVYLSFLISKKIGFSEENSLFISILVAFQPMFSFLSSVINPDAALIFAFSLFIYGAVSMLADGIGRKNIALLSMGLIAAILTKGPGLILAPLFMLILSFSVCEKFKISMRMMTAYAAIFAVAAAMIITITPLKGYLSSITHAETTSAFSSPIESLSKYLGKTITQGKLSDSSLSYWGNFGWLDASVSRNIVSFINILEIVAFLSVIISLVMTRRQLPDHLPKKSVLLFFIALITTLQLAIRFYDWRVFDTLGWIGIGQPGRYFLPNIIPHLIIVVTGIGILIRDSLWFSRYLRIFALLMILFQLYSVIDVIIPRYYL